MRAVYYEAFGGPENVKIGERADPVPDADHMLVRTGAAGVVIWDVGMMRGGRGRAEGDPVRRQYPLKKAKPGQHPDGRGHEWFTYGESEGHYGPALCRYCGDAKVSAKASKKLTAEEAASLQRFHVVLKARRSPTAPLTDTTEENIDAKDIKETVTHWEFMVGDLVVQRFPKTLVVDKPVLKPKQRILVVDATSEPDATARANGLRKPNERIVSAQPVSPHGSGKWQITLEE